MHSQHTHMQISHEISSKHANLGLLLPLHCMCTIILLRGKLQYYGTHPDIYTTIQDSSHTNLPVGIAIPILSKLLWPGSCSDVSEISPMVPPPLL